MTIKIIPFDCFVFNTLKMFKIDSPIFLQNINLLSRLLFLLFKKSMTFWDNPRILPVYLLVVPSSHTDGEVSLFQD